MTSEKVDIKSVKLSNSIEFPLIGLGTFRYLNKFLIHIYIYMCTYTLDGRLRIPLTTLPLFRMPFEVTLFC